MTHYITTCVVQTHEETESLVLFIIFTRAMLIKNALVLNGFDAVEVRLTCKLHGIMKALKTFFKYFDVDIKKSRTSIYH